MSNFSFRRNEIHKAVCPIASENEFWETCCCCTGFAGFNHFLDPRSRQACHQKTDLLHWFCVVLQVYKSLLSASVNMVKSEGPAALFKGLVPTLLQTTPHTGLQFGFYAMFTTLWKSAVSHRQASETGECRACLFIPIGFAQSKCAHVAVV